MNTVWDLGCNSRRRVRFLIPPLALALIPLLHSCCRSDAPCATPPPRLFSTSISTYAGDITTTAVVKTATSSHLILDSSQFSIGLSPLETAPVLAVGQAVRVSVCTTNQSINHDIFVVIRDMDNRLLLASSGGGFTALDAQCVPREFSVSPIDANCCGTDDGCSDIVPIGLRFRATTDVEVYSGQQADFVIDGTPFIVANALSRRFDDTGNCTDHISHQASYVVVRKQ